MEKGFRFPVRNFADGSMYMYNILVSRDTHVLKQELRILVERMLERVHKEDAVSIEVIKSKVIPVLDSDDVIRIKYNILLLICDDEDAVINITGNGANNNYEWFIIQRIREMVTHMVSPSTEYGKAAGRIEDMHIVSPEHVVYNAMFDRISSRNARGIFKLPDYRVPPIPEKLPQLAKSYPYNHEEEEFDLGDIDPVYSDGE